MLEVQNIDVFYGDLQVLWDVSFVLNPENGSIRFLDQRLDQIPANKIIAHGVVHVPEGRRLFPEMTVRENLIMGSLSPQAKRKRNETMEWIFGLFPMWAAASWLCPN
jgi:branched-chain amino acid transport system ATP-binding protein